MSELLGQLAENDPRMGMVAKVLSQREAERQQAEQDRAEAAESRAEERRESMQRLQDLVQKLYAELEELRQRNDTLSSALGACHLCWGEDAQCPECAGHASAGAWQPDPALFRELIVPAIRTARAASNGGNTFKKNGRPSTPRNGHRDSSQ
jgi:hypothetical protein